MHINNLPAELFSEILEYIPLKDASAIMQVIDNGTRNIEELFIDNAKLSLRNYFILTGLIGIFCSDW